MGFKVTFNSGNQTQTTVSAENTSSAAKTETSGSAQTASSKTSESGDNLFSVKLPASDSFSSPNKPFSVQGGIASKYGIDTSAYTKSTLEKNSIPPAGLKENMQSPDVTNLQNKYVELGLMKSSDIPKSMNFGPMTKTATENFQLSMGIAKTGKFDAATRSSMQNLYNGGIRLGETGGNVFGLQKDLVKTKYLTQAQMDANRGKFEQVTLAAVTKFQTDNGLLPTGIYDVPTFKAMQAAKAKVSNLSFHHINQGQGDYTGTVGRNNNCGFASAHMALSFLGVKGYEIKQYPANATAKQIDAVDRQNFNITMNLRFMGSGNRDDAANGLTPDVVTAAQKAGANAVDLYPSAVTNPDTKKPRTGEQRHDYYLDAMQTAFTGSEKVAFVVHGNPYLGWGDNKTLNTAYNAGTAYNGDHFVAVVGYDDKTKKFDVLDPMATKPIQVTRAQLDDYMNAAGAIINEVVKITPKD